MGRVATAVSGIALLALLLSAAQLGRHERGGPPHGDLALAGDVPATVYLPAVDALAAGLRSLPPPPDARPPAVVLMHGFASDRRGVSSLARRLAAAGYAVLTFDARGHGANRNPLPHGRGRADAFAPDLAAAVDFLRGWPLVDGGRLAVMGHSMGAGAALDFATRDSGLDAAVLISGGWTLQGPYRPPNALFLTAAGDPARITARSRGLAARLAGAGDAFEASRTYGDFRAGTAVRAEEVPGTDHASIALSAEAARRVASWLDAAFGIERGEHPLVSDPRQGLVAICALALLLVMPGLGAGLGRLLPAGAPRPAAGAGRGLAALTIALLATLPLLAAGPPAAILSVEVGDAVASHFALAGIALLVTLALRGELHRGLLARPAAALVGAALATLGFYVLAQPLGLVVHGLALTPERSLVFALAGLAFLPFTLAFQLLLRRGPTPVATAWALAGRVVALLSIVLGVQLGLLAGVVMLMLPSLAAVFALSEVLAASLYAASRNLVAIALVDAALLGLIVAVAMPIRI